jgi:transposase
MKPTLGIDIAQATFDVALLSAEDCFVKKRFANHLGGFRKLAVLLKRHGAGRVRVGLEATSTYGEALADWLYAQGHEVFVLNPERTSHYARAQGQRNKTDPTDAAMIARFVASHSKLTAYRPLSPDQRKLRSLTRARKQLIDERTVLTNQLKTCGEDARPYLQRVLTAVKNQINELLKAIKAHLKASPQLGTLVDHLTSVSGVGLVTAAVALAELPPIKPDTDVRAICAWAGLTPCRHQSGKTERPAHLGSRGNHYLRDALFMPALVAKRFNPLLRDFALKLKAKGKRPGAILGAVWDYP